MVSLFICIILSRHVLENNSQKTTLIFVYNYASFYNDVIELQLNNRNYCDKLDCNKMLKY